jgi:hypothetical protein
MSLKKITSMLKLFLALSILALFVACGGGGGGGGDNGGSGEDTYTNASLKGIWFSSASTIAENKERAYIILDGNGKITALGGFGMNTDNIGTYSVSTVGAVTMVFNGVTDADSQTATGEIVSGSRFSLHAHYQGTPDTIYFDKVTDPSLCAGTWSGTLTGYGQVRSISFMVDSNGAISSVTGFTGPVTGMMFGLNGESTSHFVTGEIAPFDELSIVGALSGNTITGTLIADKSGSTGTAVLQRASLPGAPQRLMAVWEEGARAGILGITVPGATDYKLYASTNGTDYASVNIASSTRGNSFYFLLNMSQSTYFKATAVVGGVESEKSQPCYLDYSRRDYSLLPNFAITSPADGADGVSTVAAITWNAYPSATSYMVRIEEVTSSGESLDPEVVPVLYEVSGTSMTLGSSTHVLSPYFDETLKPGTHYMLKMAVFDSLHTIIAVSSNRIKFTTAN